MQQGLHASTRVGIVAALHLLLLYFLYDWRTLGAYYVGHSYLPGHNFLLEGAASAVCLVLVFPVLLRGRLIHRAAAVVLSPVPAFLFTLAIYYVIHINMFGRG